MQCVIIVLSFINTQRVLTVECLLNNVFLLFSALYATWCGLGACSGLPRRREVPPCLLPLRMRAPQWVGAAPRWGGWVNNALCI